MNMQEEVREVSFATIVKLDTDYLKVTVNSGAAIEHAQMDEIVQAYDSLVGAGEPFYILTILPDDLNPSKDIRDYWRHPERSRRKKAEAVVIAGTALNIIAKFMSKMERPLHQVQYFKTEKDARAWLQAQRHKTGHA